MSTRPFLLATLPVVQGEAAQLLLLVLQGAEEPSATSDAHSQGVATTRDILKCWRKMWGTQ